MFNILENSKVLSLWLSHLELSIYPRSDIDNHPLLRLVSMLGKEERKHLLHCTKEYKYTFMYNIRVVFSLSLFRYGTAELCFHHVLLIAHLVSGVCWECDLFCALVGFWKPVWDEGPFFSLTPRLS